MAILSKPVATTSIEDGDGLFEEAHPSGILSLPERCFELRPACITHRAITSKVSIGYEYRTLQAVLDASLPWTMLFYGF